MPLATPEELLKHPPPPLPDWVVSRNLLPSADFQIGFRRPDVKGQPGEAYWWSNIGSQTHVLVQPFDEAMVGGQRGGAKSAALIAWFAMGDSSLSDDDPACYSYLLEPSYRGLMLRKEYQALAEFVDEAMDFFGPLGGKPKDDPVEFHFKSGAKIYTNHLGDRNAFEKYRGWGISRIGIEELTQIEEESWYLKLLGSLRAKKQLRMHNGRYFPPLRSQIMSTANPDGDGKCVPYGDVLTERGWKDIAGVKIGDRVWSVDSRTGEMVLRTVDQVHSSFFEGNLYEANGRGLHVSCTPNHKILRFNTTKKASNRLVLEEIKQFPGQCCVVRAPSSWKGHGPARVEASTMSRRREAKLKQPLSLAIDKYAALVGWMVTEGSLVKRDNALCISQKKQSGRKILKTFLDSCGFTQNWSSSGVIIYSHEWAEHFCWLPHTYEKYIPAWVKNLPVKSLKAMMNAMVDGDGHRKSQDSGAFFSSSPQLAADFCEVALKCGYIVYANGRQREASPICGVTCYTHAYSHEINFHRQTLNGSELRTGNHTYEVKTETKRVNTKLVPYSGPVYCIGVHGTHTFVIRQKGCVWISGNSWVKKRFVKVLDPYGNPIPANTPFRDPISKLTRIFIPMKRSDNPYLRDNKQYEGMLLAQKDEITRRAWMYGDWDIGSGTFFTEWRPDGPATAEEKEKYPWARHVIDAVDLRPWWFRFGGGDWGYDHPAVFHKFCRSERDGRIHAYDELTLRQCGSYEVGVRLASWWLPDLEYLPDKNVTIALSSDAFSKGDEVRTKAEQMAAGINSILGPYGAFLLKFSDDERMAMERDPHYAERMFHQHRAKAALDGKFFIVLKPASKDTVARWDYMRELLRFRPVVTETEAELKQRLTDTFNRAGGSASSDAVVAYESELARVKRPEDPASLPRLQIWRGRCPGLVRCMEEANKDLPDHPEKIKKWNAVDGIGGDDALESAGQGLHHFRDVEKAMPKSYFISERMEQIQEQYKRDVGEPVTDPTRLIMIHNKQEALYDKRNPIGGKRFTPPRASSMRHRVPQR